MAPTSSSSASTRAAISSRLRTRRCNCLFSSIMRDASSGVSDRARAEHSGHGPRALIRPPVVCECAHARDKLNPRQALGSYP